jgi:hypothetical protein
MQKYAQTCVKSEFGMFFTLIRLIFMALLVSGGFGSSLYRQLLGQKYKVRKD